MAIKVFSGIEGIDPPNMEDHMEGGYNYEEHKKAEDAYVEKLREICNKQSRHKYAGEIVRFPHADGYAQYMVITPGRLIHLPLGDAWDYPHIERLLASDIIEQIKRQKAMAELFNKKEKDAV